ncbi:4Fe-4S dicluster domain-containing protein, partial [Candidatus Bathyarchaeota archaeon]|nr:4Fe-4S dicluster domain-containing protein [Candidatus Bathyarchaeota archaeon]
YRFGETPPEPFCRDCGVCLPCPDDLIIPTVLRFDRYFTYYGLEEWTRRFYRKLPTKVNSCSKCGECETRCPYNLAVIEMLEEANKRLDAGSADD